MKKNVLELRPTQFVLGMHEVDAKVARLKALSPSKLEDYLADHVVPCVEGPSDHTYIIDHHHLVAACWHCGIDKVKIDILADRHELTQKDFWQFMRDKRWLYLYDQFGQGPHDPSQLPLDVRGLSDDLYRSLAWELRDAGLIAKVQEPFSEFKWAAYLRTNLVVDLHAETYKEVVKRAKDLVQDQISKDVKLPKEVPGLPTDLVRATGLASAPPMKT